MLRDGFDVGVFVENGVKGYYSGQVRREQSEISISQSGYQNGQTEQNLPIKKIQQRHGYGRMIEINSDNMTCIVKEGLWEDDKLDKDNSRILQGKYDLQSEIDDIGSRQ